jgi:hypothetical protein
LKRTKILIAHLASNGDILYTSVLPKQIKLHDFPDAEITWAVSERCSHTLQNHPYIDKLVVVPVSANDKMELVWEQFLTAARKEDYDHIFPLQLINNNLAKYNRTIRNSVLGLYPFPVRVALSPVVSLLHEEETAVNAFADATGIMKYQKRVLVECSPLSAQSKMNPVFAVDLIKALNKTIKDTVFILSTYKKVECDETNVVDGSVLSFRQNLALSNYCTHFIGCSSGISWLLQAENAKKLPTVQFLDKTATWFNSMIKDGAVSGLDTKHIIELFEYDLKTAVDCCVGFLREDVASVKATFNQPYSKKWFPTEAVILFTFLKKGKIGLYIKMCRNLFKASYSINDIILIHFSILKRIFRKK